MLAISESECIIHKDAIKPKDLARLKLHLGSVHTLDCDDKFCLNAIIDGENIITHKLVHKETKDTLEAITGKSVIECDVSEFEKAGGGGIDGFKRILEVETTHIHDTTPCFFGSNEEIKRLLKAFDSLDYSISL